jgi:hypothetical protein
MMTPTGVEWNFPHEFKIVADHTGYELTCDGKFVVYSKDLGLMLEVLGKLLKGENQ